MPPDAPDLLRAEHDIPAHDRPFVGQEDRLDPTNERFEQLFGECGAGSDIVQHTVLAVVQRESAGAVLIRATDDVFTVRLGPCI